MVVEVDVVEEVLPQPASRRLIDATSHGALPIIAVQVYDGLP